jgi:ParB family chromosome partitioning protein
MATTPAAIAPEATAAHSTEYEPLLHLGRIHVHPHNPRHDAVADDELIASIRDQGLIHDLVVAPHPDREGDYILIDGHRRFDGLTKAGYTYAPAKIRLDLLDEADQIAAMLATIRRQDLTPIEEAEGFDLLAELGWTVDQIAAATGRSASTVKARRKLTSLKPTFQEQVSAGQVTLDDAIHLAALPEKEQKRLEKLPATQLPYELKRSQARVEQQRRVDKEIKDLTKLGATEQKMPKGGYYWNLTAEKNGMTPLGNLPLFLREADRHEGGCLGWLDTGTAQYPGISLVCTDVPRHDDEIAAHHAEVAAARTEEEKARDAEREARAAEEESKRVAREEAAESRRVAARMRGDVVLEATRKVKTQPVLDTVIRATLRDFFVDWPLDEQLFQELADVPEGLRWTSWNGAQPYLETIPTMKPAPLWRAFVAALVAHIERDVDEAIVHREVGYDEDTRPITAAILDEYLTNLRLAGHVLTPPDEDLAVVLDNLTAAEKS